MIQRRRRLENETELMNDTKDDYVSVFVLEGVIIPLPQRLQAKHQSKESEMINGNYLLLSDIITGV